MAEGVNIYDYGHWEGLRFIFDKEQTAKHIDRDGVGDKPYKILDFTEADMPDDITPDDLDAFVAGFLDNTNVSVPWDGHDDGYVLGF